MNTFLSAFSRALAILAIQPFTWKSTLMRFACARSTLTRARARARKVVLLRTLCPLVLSVLIVTSCCLLWFIVIIVGLQMNFVTLLFFLRKEPLKFISFRWYCWHFQGQTPFIISQRESRTVHCESWTRENQCTKNYHYRIICCHLTRWKFNYNSRCQILYAYRYIRALD